MSKNLPVLVEKAHATLGASTASRWMNCPGSVALIAHVGEGSNETDASREGTCAHAVAEQCLNQGTDPSDYAAVGAVIGGVPVTESMAEHVKMFVDYCRTLQQQDGGAWPSWVERKFSLEALNPPVPMFGTADFVNYDGQLFELEVVDLKFGAGVVVQVKNNKQLRYYALGALISLGALYPVERVKITIVQPRVSHPDGPIRSEEITIDELVEFTSELLEAARRTQEPNAPLKLGDHCRFCPAMAICPEQREHAMTTAQMDFDVVESIPPLPATLPQALFEEMLPKLEVLDAWIKAMRAHAERRLKDGEPVAGYKLVERRPRRQWIDEKATYDRLEAEGYKLEEIEVRELKSPAQIEKLTGKKEFPAELVVKKSSGVTLAPEHDARPAASLTRGEEFDAIPATTEND